MAKITAALVIRQVLIVVTTRAISDATRQCIESLIWMGARKIRTIAVHRTFPGESNILFLSNFSNIHRSQQLTLTN